MPFRKLVGSYKDYTLSTHVIEAGYLAVDTSTGDLRIGDGTTPGGTLLASGNLQTIGAVTFFGTKLTSPSNGDIEIEPGGTGNLLVQGLQFHDNEISTRNSNEPLVLSAAGTGKVNISGLSYPSSDGSAGQFLQTDGSGTLSFASVSVGDFSFVGSTIISPSNADITLSPSGSGGIALNANTTITGNLTVTGTQTTLETTTLVVEDPLLELAKNNSGGGGENSLDQGLLINRGSLDNVAFIWDESADQFATAVTSGEDGTTAGNVTIDSYAGLRVGALTTSTATLGGIQFAGTTLSSSDSTVINVNEGLVVDGTLTANSISGLTSTTIENTSTSDSLSITTTEDSSTAAPVIMLKRNSSSPADADYLGQLKFKGENDNDQEITYAKITAKIQDASDSSEDGLLEFANIKAGSQTITARLKSNVFQLLNSTALEVGGYTFPTSDGTAGQVLQTDGSGTISFGTISVGDLSIVGSSILSPSSADLTLNSSGGNVVVEGIRIAGTTLSTEDSSAGIQITGNLIPSADGVFQLGSESRRWQILYVSAETIDVGGATIKSDGSGAIEIAATGATLPEGSKVSNQPIALNGTTAKTQGRPVQNVKIFVSDGSTTFTDAQLLAGTADLTLEFNATVEDVPVYTEANQTFTLADGTALTNNAAGVTLFQF